VPVRSSARRGVAIDLILDRSRKNRSRVVFTKARGRDAVFWQSPRTHKQARPDVHTPTARAADIPELAIVVDAHEQSPYKFADQQFRTTYVAQLTTAPDGGPGGSCQRVTNPVSHTTCSDDPTTKQGKPPAGRA
jgi:hypothetical protein